MTRLGLIGLLRKGQAWSRLSRPARSLFLQAWLLFPLVALSLRLGGLKRTQALLLRSRKSEAVSPTKAQVPQIATTVHMVNLAAKYSAPWANCLKKSLILDYLLRRQGIASQLQIGVRLEPGSFQAHAWVECQGFVVGDRPDIRQSYAAFEKFDLSCFD